MQRRRPMAAAWIGRRSILTGALLSCLASPRLLADYAPSAWCLAWKNDGSELVAGYSDGTIRVWDPALGKSVRVLTGHTDAVFGVAISPDGRRLASCGRDEPRLQIWDLSSGKRIRGIAAHPGWVWTAQFAPGSGMLASCGNDPTIRLWDPESGALLRELSGHRGTVKRLVWTPDGTMLLSGGDDQLLHLWDPATGAEKHALAGHTSWLEGVATYGGDRAVTIAGDQTVRTWDLRVGKPLEVLSERVPDPSCVAVAPGGEWAVAGAASPWLWVWRLDPARLLVQRAIPSPILDARFRPDGKLLATAHRDGTVRLWSAPEWHETAMLRAPAA